MSSKLSELCQKVLELDSKATPGPWEKVPSLPVYAVCSDGIDVVTATGREYALVNPNSRHGCSEQNAELIAHYRTACVKLALAAQRMEDWMQANIPEIECQGGEDCDHCFGIEILYDVQKIVEGE